MQVDSPQKLYNQPNNLFVAGFIGSPQMNFVDAEVAVEGETAVLKFGGYSVALPAEKSKKIIAGGYKGKTVTFGIRPEDITDDAELMSTKFSNSIIESDVTGYELLGSEVLLYYTIAGANMTARVDSDTPARYGDHIKLAFDPTKIHVFDKDTEQTITN
jgi:multiple sugar transport system ATP-binding protein